MKVSKFPQDLYILKQKDGDSEYFLAYDNESELLDYNGEEVAIYQFITIKKINVKVAVE